MHGVRDIYLSSRQISGIGALGEDGVAAPPGAQLPGNVPTDILAQLATALRMTDLGVYTPWAVRSGNMSWDAVRQPPETNVAVAALTDPMLAAAVTMTFGSPVPFVGILCNVSRATGIRTQQEIEAAFSGTPYELFETSAVYSQADAGEPPTIQLLHWARIRNQGDSDGGGAGMESVARLLGGRLVFAMQANYDSTRQRGVPATLFQSALDTQLGTATPGPGPGPGPSPGPVTPAPDPVAAKSVNGQLILLGMGAGLVAGGVAFMLTRQVQKKRASR
jgi:hypothetical protein